MQVGFYGKLPSHGDFLRRRVSDAFVDAWDAWLRECLAASRTALGTRWLDVYLTSPAWRFVCAAGACGPAPVIGLVAPSVDQVGRYFPLTLVAELPADVSLVTAASSTAVLRRPPNDWSSKRWRPSASTSIGSIAACWRLEQELAPIDASPSGSCSTPAPSAILTDSPQAWQLPLGRFVGRLGRLRAAAVACTSKRSTGRW